MKTEQIKERLVKKAVDLWCEKLKKPTFDNGDKSENGAISQGLQHMLVAKELAKTNNLEARIERFRKNLVNIIKDLKPPIFLDVDYGPTSILSKAAEEASIPKSLFAWKSTVIITKNLINVSWGYGSPCVSYYPLENGKWLVTSLTGDEKEMQKIFDSVVNGNPLGLQIEE